MERNLFSQNQIFMFLKPKVLRSFYKKLKQGEIPNFVKGILLKMKDNPKYADLAVILTKVEDQLEIYETALAAAANRGIEQIAEKDLAKDTLISLLDELSDGVDFFGKKELNYFIGTGLPLQTKQSNHSGMSVLVPINFTATSNGQPGGITVRYKLEPNQKSIFKMVGFEWSIDQVTWFNGDYSSKQKFDVSDKPSNQKVFVRIRTIATDGRKSPWTEAIPTSVL